MVGCFASSVKRMAPRDNRGLARRKQFIYHMILQFFSRFIMHTDPLVIVTVVNDRSCYHQTIQENPCMNRHRLVSFDNTGNAAGIPALYNRFLKEEVVPGAAGDSWVVFCHQDFGFREDPSSILNRQETDCIYGIRGVKKRNRRQLKFRRILGVLPVPFLKMRVVALGRILQGYEPDRYKRAASKKVVCDDGRWFYVSGRFLKRPEEVDTIDCCCIMIHSALLREQELFFDEKLTWHCYAEEFCLNARYNKGIKTKALQIEAKHLSRGNAQTEEFRASFLYLKEKYKNREFCTTCGHTYRTKA